MAEEKERRGVLLNDGSFFPGFDTQGQADQAITENSERKKVGGKSVRLYGKTDLHPVEKGGDKVESTKTVY